MAERTYTDDRGADEREGMTVEEKARWAPDGDPLDPWTADPDGHLRPGPL